QLGRKWLISERLLAAHLERETQAQTEIRKKALPQTPRLKRAIELASAYAMGRGQDYTGTEHLLIGMMQEGENVAALVMKKMGIEPDEPREVFESQLPATGKIAQQAPHTDRSRVA